MPLTERFLKYFSDKIESIVRDLKEIPHRVIPGIAIRTTAEIFDCFLPVQEEQLMTLITKSKSTMCSLDPVPTSLIKLCINELAPILTASLTCHWRQVTSQTHSNMLTFLRS